VDWLVTFTVMIFSNSSSIVLIIFFASTSIVLIRYNFQDNLEAKVVVAGLSTTCSQKIHNQLVSK
jgi:hypothetical protein